MTPYNLPAHTYQSGIVDQHQPLPLVPAKNVTQLKTGKIQRTNQEDAERGDFFVVSDQYERYRIQPLSPFAATNHGVVRRTKVIPKNADEDINGPLEDNLPQGEQDTFVVFGFANGSIQSGFILGHIIPQVSQMGIPNVGLVDRHYTDNTHIIDDDGNMAEYSPDGTGVTVAGEGFDHPNKLDPGHYDKNKNFDHDDLPWKLDNKEPKEYTINQQSGGTRLKFQKDGNIVMQRDGATFQIHDDNKVSITSSGPQGMNAPTITFDTNSGHFTGDLHVQGTIYASNVQAVAGSVPGPPSDAAAGSPSAGSPVRNTINKPQEKWNY